MKTLNDLKDELQRAEYVWNKTHFIDDLKAVYALEREIYALESEGYRDFIAEAIDMTLPDAPNKIKRLPTLHHIAALVELLRKTGVLYPALDNQ